MKKLKSHNIVMLLLTALLSCITAAAFVAPAFDYKPLPVQVVVLSIVAIAVFKAIKETEKHTNILQSCLTAVSANITADCAAIPVKGVEGTFYIGNFSDLKTITPNSTNADIIELIALNTGTLMYTFEGLPKSLKPKSVGKQGKYVMEHTHEIGAVAFKLDGATRLQLDKLSNGKVFVIVKNNWKGTAGETTYRVYGLGTGMVMTDMVEDPWGDTSSIQYTLKSDQDSPESSLPKNFYKTSASVTDGMIATLLIAAV